MSVFYLWGSGRDVRTRAIRRANKFPRKTIRFGGELTLGSRKHAQVTLGFLLKHLDKAIEYVEGGVLMIQDEKRRQMTVEALKAMRAPAPQAETIPAPPDEPPAVVPGPVEVLTLPAGMAATVEPQADAEPPAVVPEPETPPEAPVELVVDGPPVGAETLLVDSTPVGSQELTVPAAEDPVMVEPAAPAEELEAEAEDDVTEKAELDLKSMSNKELQALMVQNKIPLPKKINQKNLLDAIEKWQAES